MTTPALKTLNRKKQHTYMKAVERVDRALKEGWYFDAVAIEESMICDRLWSHVQGATGLDVPERESFGNLLRRFEKLHGSSVLLGELNAFREERNFVLHASVKAPPGGAPIPWPELLRRAKAAAIQGRALFRRLDSVCRKEKLKAERSSALPGATAVVVAVVAACSFSACKSPASTTDASSPTADASQMTTDAALIDANVQDSSVATDAFFDAVAFERDALIADAHADAPSIDADRADAALVDALMDAGADAAAALPTICHRLDLPASALVQGTAPELGPLESWTIEGWFHLSHTTSTTLPSCTLFVPFGFGAATYSADLIPCLAGVHGAGTWVWHSSIIGDVPADGIPPNRWVHIAITYDLEADQYVAFVNGAIIGTNASVDGVATSSGYPFLFPRGIPSGLHASVRDMRFSRGVRYTQAFDPALVYGVDSATLAYWPFDDAAPGFARDLVSGRDAMALADGVTFSSEMCDWPAPNAISVPFAPPDDFSWSTAESAYTFESWVWLAASGEGTMFGRADDVGAVHAITWNAAAPVAQLSFTTGREITPGAPSRALLVAELQRERWHHVAAVVDRRDLRLYVNGVLGDSATIPSPYTPWSLGDGAHLWHTVAIAGNGATVDEFRMSRIARYEGDSFAAPDHLSLDAQTIGLWLFDEPVGPIVFDSSPNLLHGMVGIYAGERATLAR